MKIKHCKNIIIGLIIFFILSLFIKKEKEKRVSFFKDVDILNESINFETLSFLEQDILNKYKKMPKEQYSDRYKEVVENNRPLLNFDSVKVGVYILKDLLSSNELSPKQELYVLNKLRVLDSLSGNIVNTIKITMRYLNLAERLNSEYDIATAKIGLAAITNTLGNYKATIDILNSIHLKKEESIARNKVKILKNYHLSETYFLLKEYEKGIEHLNKIPELLKNQSNDYKENIFVLINLLYAQILIEMDTPDKAIKNLEVSHKILINIKKYYFSNLEIFYSLVLEKYNLEYDIKKFNVTQMKNNIEVLKGKGDLISLEIAFEILFKYYIKINDLVEYKNLSSIYFSNLKTITDANNKFFSLYLIKNLEHEKILNENDKLYVEILILLCTILIILTTLDKKIETLDMKSKMDVLTGIGNRLAFNIKLKEIGNKNYYMLLFDIDNFKKINDTYGHDFGDEVLSAIGVLLKTIENKEIKAYRVGGEEFVMIFSNINQSYSIEMCEYIRKSIENLKWKYPTIVTISGGFSKSTEETYKNCDLRLYEAKSDGKNLIIYQ